MSKKFKLGILGIGRGSTALFLLKHMKEYVEITAIVESDKALIESWKNHSEDWKDDFPETAVVYDTYDEMIQSGIDAVILSDYFHTHCDHAIKALEAGVSVFSETTAAPTLGDCVRLVEASEKSNAKYMLMANCAYFKALQLAKKKMQDGEYGPLNYADAEYCHPVDYAHMDKCDLENIHWREQLPPTYYNMHSLGPLMYITNTEPKKVMAKVGGFRQHPVRPLLNRPKAFVLTEMDNGAVFNTTGCVGVGTPGKWYRLAFETGTMETERNDEETKILLSTGINHNDLFKESPTWKDVHREEPSWVEAGSLTQEEFDEFGHIFDVNADIHCGIDLVMCVKMLQMLRGNYTPFFDVYRSVALSATAILGWYSILEGGKEYDIPDFKDPEQRNKVRDDFRSPFAKRAEDMTLPCGLKKDEE